MNILKKAIKAAEEFEAASKIPEFTLPPNVGSSVQSNESMSKKCKYLLPCGYCDVKGAKCSLFYDDSKVKKDILLGKGLHPIGVADPCCAECAYDGLGMSRCEECNASNNFKYFESLEGIKYNEYSN